MSIRFASCPRTLRASAPVMTLPFIVSVFPPDHSIFISFILKASAKVSSFPELWYVTIAEPRNLNVKSPFQSKYSFGIAGLNSSVSLPAVSSPKGLRPAVMHAHISTNSAVDPLSRATKPLPH